MHEYDSIIIKIQKANPLIFSVSIIRVDVGLISNEHFVRNPKKINCIDCAQILLPCFRFAVSIPTWNISWSCPTHVNYSPFHDLCKSEDNFPSNEFCGIAKTLQKTQKSTKVKENAAFQSKPKLTLTRIQSCSVFVPGALAKTFF